MEPIKVVYPKATLLAHTPEPEKVVAFAAKLCYSNTEPDKIWESLTNEEVSRYLSHLEGYGHESPIEHASFTFLITDMTRSCLAQITRHRIASFSVQSQRYINFSDFHVGVPEYIEYPLHHKLINKDSPFSNYTGGKMQFRIDDAFVNAIAESKKDYILIRDRILFMLLSYFICENTDELFGDQDYIKIPENEEHMPYYATLEKKWYSEGYPYINPESDFMNYEENDQINIYKILFMGNDKFKKAFNKYSKIANENARAVLPNACTCNMVITMNARELRHFFTLRCCNRAQAEIRNIAWQMLTQCKEVAPTLFANAGPGCIRGGCTEGKMTCGNPYKKDE